VRASGYEGGRVVRGVVVGFWAVEEGGAGCVV
jgi:hypothetical protein